MKFAIPTVDGKFDAPFSSRFARCEVFIFVDTESRSRETMANPAAAASGGAGAQVVQFLADHGVEATVAGHYGPTAMTALKAAGIQAFAAGSGTPAELLDRLLAGELERVDTATGAAGHEQAGRGR
jgi:predicted Fe-Mo cluster-binding NifX family protein